MGFETVTFAPCKPLRRHSKDHDDAVRAVTLIEVEGRSTDQVIRALRGLPQVQALHTTSGGWDLVAELRCATLGEFDRLLGQTRSVNSETSLLLSSVLR